MVPRVTSLPAPRYRLLFAGCCLLLIVACGEEFSSGQGASGGSGAASSGGRSGSAGMGASGGSTSGGNGNQGGDTGSSGSGGSASCSCEAGQYCRAGKCRDCSDPSMLDFAEPELLATFDSGIEPNPSFPRTGGSDSALFYSSGHPASGHLYFTPDFNAGAGQHVSGQSAPPEFGPLYLENSGGLDFDLLFTRTPQDTSSMIMAADWNEASSTFSGAMPVPGPVNDDFSNDYSVAFAPGTTRLWWMSDRGGTPALYTSVLNDLTSPEQTVTLDIPGSAGASCVAAHPDLTPWVTPDGTLMLFSAEAVDGQCATDSTTDLYAVPLDASGEPAVSPALALNDVNLPGSHETTPSLSADRCWLYFASDSGTGTFSIYRAARR